MKKILFILALFIFSFSCILQNDINIQKEKEEQKDDEDNAKEYPYFAKEFLDLFDHNKLHIFEIQITQEEWNGMIQDMLDKASQNYRSGKLRKANFIYKGTTTEPTNDIIVEEIGIRTKGNTTRILPEDPIGSENYHRSHFLIKFNEEFSLQEGSQEYIARKDRRFKKLRGLNLKWSMADSEDDRSRDPSMIRELYSYDFLNRCGVYAPKTGSAKLYIKIGNKPVKYFGIYTIIEPVDKSFLKKRFGPDGNDGNLYKCLWQQNGPATLKASISGKIGVKNFETGYFPSYQRETNESDTNYSDIINFSNNITNLTGSAFKTYIDANFEVDRFIRWIAANVLLGMPDDYWSMGNNYFLYFNNNTKKIDFIPYDYDHGLGGGWDGGVGYDSIMNANIYQWFYTAGGNRTDRPLVDKILNISEYKAKYENYLKEWTDPLTGIFKYSDYVAKFNSLYSFYSSHIDNDINEGEVMSNESYVEDYFNGKIASVRSQLGLSSPQSISSFIIKSPINPPTYNSKYYYFTNSSINVEATGDITSVTFTLKKRESENNFTTIQTITDTSSPFETIFNPDFGIYRITATAASSSKDIDFFRYDNSLNSPEVSGNNVTFRWKKSGLSGSENVYIRGGFNSWNIDNNYKMVWNSSGNYFEKTVTITNTGNLEYKFYNQDSNNWFYDPHNYKNNGDNYINSILQK